MALSTQPYKGARDFYPEDKRIQKHIFKVIRSTVEKFGYEEYDAPILEPLELYLAKSGEEIVNEQTYAFTDRGGRQVAIRPEMTPSVSRMVAAKRQELAYPLRWYSIPNLWRYERPQRGRLREHWQLNVDIFGVPGIEAEHEIILLVDKILQAFHAKRSTYTIKLNSRKFTDHLLESFLGFDTVQAHSMRKLIDRMHKLDHAEFVAGVNALCTQAQRTEKTAERLLKVLEAKRFSALPLQLLAHPSITDLHKMVKLLKDAGGVTNVEFDPTLMRGFDYYTDIVFEVFDLHPENNRSLFGGGRYDGLVGLFGADPIQAVGVAPGATMTEEFLRVHDLLPKFTSSTDVYMIVLGSQDKAARSLAEKLREEGVRVAVDLTDRKLDKQIKAAVKQQIPYLLFIGEKEVTDEVYRLKDIEKETEQELSVERIITTIQDRRRKQRVVKDEFEF